MSNPNDKRFLVDGMLGNIVKKLRLMGFDSEFAKNKSDNDVMKMMEEQNRILITKDIPLSQKAKKEQIGNVQITKEDEIDQFLQINERTNLGKCSVSGNNSRCSVCNGELQYIEKNDILDKVPTGVLENMNDFWKCKKCEKIYWEGTHITNLQKFTEELNDRL